VLVSPWPSHHETPEEDRSDAGIPKRGKTQAVFRCLLALPLLPVTNIEPAIQDIKVLVHDDTPSKTLLLQLCRYVEHQWLNKSSIGAARMSIRGNPMCTNNATESFHLALQRRVKAAHPNLYTFLGHL